MSSVLKPKENPTVDQKYVDWLCTTNYTQCRNLLDYQIWRYHVSSHDKCTLGYDRCIAQWQPMVKKDNNVKEK